ncbi:DUF2069 domain-containing protein [Chitinimonas lacunae]|uniref:DUF2069 domain-containing protein n=1 Tax=Chitinimonas lacunae TaxID=1963018 RepID=A0ABV8MSV1_9NEIS
MNPMLRWSRNGAVAGMLALFSLCLAWELWLAPLHPGGSWLALKALPLLCPLPGLVRGHRYTYQWTSMFVLAWFTEGVMRAWSERGASQYLAGVEIALSVVVFSCVVVYARFSRGVAR